MKRCTFLIAIAAMCVAAHLPAYAATEPGGEGSTIIKGGVYDASSKSPLEFANIVLKSATDSVMVTATYSGQTGEFILANVAEGKYFLKISYIGYAEKIIPDINIRSGAAQHNLGDVLMDEQTLAIGNVTVEAERPMEEFHLDKKVINAAKYPAAAGGTALDVLRNQPSVQVDATDNVTLRGSSTFTVLVNGRPSVFQGADALRQIPANIIDNIELITNPSAKYDAEGAAGIININLKKEAVRETRGMLNLTSGLRDKYSGDISLNHSMGPVSLSGGFEYSNNTYWQVQDIERTATVTTGDMLNNTDVDRRDIRKRYNLRLGAEYTANEQNIYSLSGRTGLWNMGRRHVASVHNSSPESDEYTYIHNDFTLEAPYLSAVAHYAHKFRPGTSELSFENSYTTVDMPYSQNTNEFPTEAGFASRPNTPLLQSQDNDNWRYENTSKIDYFTTFSDGGKIEAGAQTRFSVRHYNVDYKIFDGNNASWMLDTARSNRFDYDNNIHAAYLTYANSIAGFGFQAGLRAEYMDRLLTQQTLESAYAYNKLDWFPSASISKQFGKEQIQVSYSRRITRPDEMQLNPFPYYSDSYLTSAGNPELLPEYINSYELNLQHIERGAVYSAQTYYRASTNAVWRSQQVDENGRLTTDYGNFAETTSLGIELSSSHTLTSWLRLDPNVNMFNYALKGAAFNDEIDTEAFTWTARINATFTLSPSTVFQLTGMYMSRQIHPQSVIDPRFYMTAVVRQDFFDKAFTVIASASNIFTSAYYEITGTGTGFMNHYIIKPEVPMVNLTLSYNINNYRRSNTRLDDVNVNVGG